MKIMTQQDLAALKSSTNQYIVTYHHFMGSKHGVAKFIISAASERSAKYYIDEHFKHPDNWKLADVTLIGVDMYA